MNNRCTFWWVESDGTPHSCFDWMNHVGPHIDILGTPYSDERPLP